MKKTLMQSRNYSLLQWTGLQQDFGEKLFGNYSPSMTIPKIHGFEVTNIDDALEYLPYHEGYHGGCIISLKTSCIDKFPLCN